MSKLNDPNSHPIAQLIAAASIDPGELAIIAEAIAKQARNVYMTGLDPHNLMERVSRTLPPYDPAVHGVTRPGFWVGGLWELTYEDDRATICEDSVLEILEPLIDIWGNDYRYLTRGEAKEVGENYRILGSCPTQYGELIVEIAIKRRPPFGIGTD